MKTKPFLLVFFLVAGLVPAQAAQFGDFEYQSDGTAVTITRYSGAGGEVIIPETISGLPVTAILGYWGEGRWYGAFQDCTGLTSITIPDSVTSIGGWAFWLCTSLTGITVDALNAAFSSHDGVLFSKSQATLIHYPAAKAGTYTISDKVTSIEDGAFFGCTGLTSITIPDSVTSIGAYAFSDCTGLTSVMIGNRVTGIGEWAFIGCTGLTDITIPDSVTSIGDGVFQECSSLTCVTIGSSVTNKAERALDGCTSLTRITVKVRNPSYSSLDGVLFDKNQTTILRYPAGKAGDYVLPMSVSIIESGSFRECTGLTGVTIPDSITSIGDSAFSGCTCLTSITIPDSVTSIGGGAFSGCSRLTSVRIGDGATSIAYETFCNCTRLTNVVMGASVARIEGSWCPYGCFSGAFAGCEALARIYFEGNAPSLEFGAFDDVGDVAVYYLPGASGWGPTFDGRPTALWQPYVSDCRVVNDQFGFRISWAANANVVVDASLDLSNPTWSPVSTNTLTDGTATFSDPDWAKYPARFYRVRGE